MKIRSKALYTYLSDAGVLNGTPEQISYAKHCYRKLYKKNWKLQKRPRKELRIEFTLKQYLTITAAAIAIHLRPTTYARQILLAAADTRALAISKDEVLAVLQLVSMSYNALQCGLIHNALSYVRKAETQLLHLQNKMI